MATDIELAAKVGVSELPALFLNGTRLPPIAPEVIAFLVESELAKKNERTNRR